MSVSSLLLAAMQVVAASDPALVLPTHPDSARHAPPVVVPNDNRRAAGTLTDGVLTVRLEAREGTWHPEGPRGPGLRVAAWAEEGRPLENPGPLLRVRAGTEVRATLRNALARPLTVHGLGARRGRGDSVVVAPGATRAVRFVASEPGTFHYTGRTGTREFGSRLAEDTQLNGALVVDVADGAAGGAPRAPRYGERVFLMSIWFTFDSTSPTGLGRATMAINGLSWPHTERQDLVQGDSVRWRVINLTGLDHPMHLHGFYFRVDAKGTGAADTTYAPEQRRLAVTEVLLPSHTMTITWAPTRPGNWIFHCHFAGHLSHLVSLDTERGAPRAASHATSHAGQGGSHAHQMYGLVLGIRVAPRGRQVADTRPARAIRLLVRERPNAHGARAGLAYVLGGTPAEADPAAMPVPGPTLVLTRGERVAVTIVNHATERAAVHWHGIELESYADGVPDWSGHGAHVLPSVAPGDSITVRFTPPRAGTFMYHSHFNEDHQINAGLHAPLVVLEPGERWDPETDRVLLFSSAGPTTNVIRGPWAPTLLNGQLRPAPIELRAGVRHRLRLINITGDVGTVVRLLDGDRPVAWHPLAKDGATLPASQRLARPAVLFFEPGETYDFAYVPEAGRPLTLRFGPPDAPPAFGLPKPVTVPVPVRDDGR